MADYAAKLAEHDALPDDINTRLEWGNANPPPVLTITCRCGHSRPKQFQLTWDDVRRELKLHGAVPTNLETQACDFCEPDEVDLEDD